MIQLIVAKARSMRKSKIKERDSEVTKGRDEEVQWVLIFFLICILSFTPFLSL